MRKLIFLLLALVALAVAGCGGLEKVSALQGPVWVLRVYQAADQTAALTTLSPPITASFDRGTLSGSGGCNDYTTTYEVSGSTLTIAPIAATMVSCPAPVGDQEQAYFAALANVASYAVEDDVLTLRDADLRPILLLSAQQSLPLIGTPWAAVQVNNGSGAVVTVPADSRITALFGEDRKVVGFTGCNRYAGPFRDVRESIRIGPLATTRLVCSGQEASDIEAQFLAALDATTRFQLAGATLELRDADGALQVSFQLTLLAPEATPIPEPTAAPSDTPKPTATAKPSATPKPTATAKPSASPKPTAAPSATPEPTAGPTATPEPTPSPVALTTCQLSSAGVVVSYPAAWYTVDDDPLYSCVLFGPDPVTVDLETKQTNAQVAVLTTTTVTYDEVVAGFTNPQTWTEVTTTDTTVSGLPATTILGTATGAGSAPAGMTQYSYVVNQGDQGIVMIQTAAQQGSTDFTSNQEVVDLMAENIAISTPS